jgi:hypothetical protein
MLRKHAHIIAQWDERFEDRLHERGIIAAGQVGSANAARE